MKASGAFLESIKLWLGQLFPVSHFLSIPYIKQKYLWSWLFINIDIFNIAINMYSDILDDA